MQYQSVTLNLFQGKVSKKQLFTDADHEIFRDSMT